MNRFRLLAASLALASTFTAGCAAARSETRPGDDSARVSDSVATSRTLAGMANGAWESTYTPLPSEPTLIENATIMTAAGEEIESGDVLMENGKIAAVGTGLTAPAGAVVIDASGRFVTPGIIDTHSHLGVYPSPGVDAHSEGNEATDPTTPEVWAIHSVWPQDPGFTRALAGGVTALQILPGSANLIGGRGVTLKPIPGRSAQDMMFPGAPMGLKMACGENPKRVYDDEGPSTRMGNWAGYREAFIQAQKYRAEWDRWMEDGGEKPDRNLANETLAQVLRGEILVQNHCYRADDMVNMLNLAKEFGFEVRSFHHAVEAYKIRDYLARESVAASMWTDWWGFKMEAWDMVPQNIALVSEAGARAILHTDDDMEIQIMNQGVAHAMVAGRQAGLDVTRDEALRWITANPAWALGLADEIGTLEAGKNGDVVIWSGDPFSVYSHADQVFIDGAIVYDRLNGVRPVTDFEAGMLPPQPGVEPAAAGSGPTGGTGGGRP